MQLAGGILNRVLPPGLARRVRTLPHAVGGEVDDPITSAIAFKEQFRADYGSQMPDFVETSHKEALRMAQHELKFLFVYLHSPSHADAPSFCRDVLTNPGVVSMLNDNFVCWGGDVRKSDAFQLATGVVASTFPYVALLSSVNSHNRPSLVMACEGAVGVDHLLALLTQTMEEQSGTMTAARNTRAEHDEARRLREEQDLAYQASLEADARREMEAAEAAKAAEKAAKAAEEEAAAKKAAEEERLRNIARRREEKEAALRQKGEPAADTPGVCKIAVKLPDGSRKDRRFLSEDTVNDVFNFVDTLEGLGEKYSLVSNFPRRVYSRVEDAAVTLAEGGLHPQAMLMYREDD